MLTLKSFRKLLDTTSNYVEMIPHIQEILTGDVNMEFGNSLLHTLSLFSEEDLTFAEWNELHEAIKSKLDVSKFNETTYHSIIRLMCSHFGFQYTEQKVGFTTVINSMIEEMELQEFTLRRRTFFPIIQRCHKQKNSDLALQIYLNCQVRKIALEPIDHVCLLGTLRPEFHNTVILDMVSNQTIFDKKAISLLQKIYPAITSTTSDNLGKIIPSFKLSKLEQTQVLNTLRTHVDSITRSRRPLLKSYDQFIARLKKIRYSVVIDGANVGRYNQGTKSQGELNFNQINTLVRELVEKGESVILCLNENHLKKVNPKYERTVSYLRENCQILETTRGLDDDLFWLYASIYRPQALLVTNDELRNHIHGINGSFEKWKEYRRVTYDIQKTNSSKIQIKYPLTYEVKPFYQKEQKKLYVPASISEWYQVSMG